MPRVARVVLYWVSLLAITLVILWAAAWLIGPPPSGMLMGHHGA